MKPLSKVIVGTIKFMWTLLLLFFYGVDGTNSSSNGNSTVGPTTANYTVTRMPMDTTRPMKLNFKGIGVRAIYVVTAVSGVLVLYFIVRAICSRRQRNRTRRYGILNTDSRDNMEMRPLSEQDDDDDDDMTLFDISKRKGRK